MICTKCPHYFYQGSFILTQQNFLHCGETMVYEDDKLYKAAKMWKNHNTTNALPEKPNG